MGAWSLKQNKIQYNTIPKKSMAHFPSSCIIRPHPVLIPRVGSLLHLHYKHLLKGKECGPGADLRLIGGFSDDYLTGIKYPCFTL